MSTQSTEPAAPFVVTGRRRNGTVTYLCPDADWALRKRKQFEEMGYAGITVTGPDGAPIDEAGLLRAVDRKALPAPASS